MSRPPAQGSSKAETTQAPVGAAAAPSVLERSARVGALALAANWIAARRGFWRYLLALASGALAALSMAPYHIIPALFVAFTILVWQLDGIDAGKRPLRMAALTGWAFGTGFFAVSLYWIGNAFLVDAATFGALMPGAIIALASGLALFPALTIGIARRLWPAGSERILVLAIAWSAAEWLRGHVLSGFPWNLAAHAWGDTLPILQTTSLIGIYGLSLVTVIAAGAPATLVRFRMGGATTAPARQWIWPGAIAAIFAGLFAFGEVRLHEPDAPDLRGVRLRLIQPSVPQHEKMQSGTAARIFEQHMMLMRAPGAEQITHFVWPEAAVPILLANDQTALSEIASLLGPHQWLIAGSARFEPEGERYFNSLHVLSTDGTVVETYDKHHLVPFGEYLPFPHFLESIGLRQLVQNASGFTSGNALHTITIPGLPEVGPLICYEAIFPDDVIDRSRRPQWLLNITDDTWFGLGAGPRQHFENARIRAIEEGLPLIRAANNGISAAIDAKGRIRQSLVLNEIGVLDTDLPPAERPPFYSRFGDFGYLALIFAAALLAYYRCQQPKD